MLVSGLLARPAGCASTFVGGQSAGICLISRSVSLACSSLVSTGMRSVGSKSRGSASGSDGGTCTSQLWRRELHEALRRTWPLRGPLPRAGGPSVTRAELREAAARIIERSCREQNIPIHVEDASVLGEVATLLRARREHSHGQPKSDSNARTAPSHRPLRIETESRGSRRRPRRAS